jgi:hypothetical protein
LQGKLAIGFKHAHELFIARHSAGVQRVPHVRPFHGRDRGRKYSA